MITWLTKSAVFTALHLSLGYAQEYSADLSILSGLSSKEVEDKLASDPVLLRTLLQAANIKLGSIRRPISSLQEDMTKPVGEEKPNPINDMFPEMFNTTPNAIRNIIDHSLDITMATSQVQESYADGLEYLGLGYNVLTGNPRGSSSSELDPGFGFPVLSLDESSPDQTRKMHYPNVSFLKGSKACTYSEGSKDISSASDYIDNLSKESTSDTSLNLGFNGFGVEFSSATSFSRSENMQQFKQEKATMNTVSFESTAKCTEYSVQINPYEKLTLNPTFQTALNGLPESYDSNNAELKTLYKKFLAAYGTHFISQLDMGGKLVVTNEISATDVMSLTRSNIDISSTLSFEKSFSFADEGQPWGTKDAERKELFKPVCCGDKFTSPMESLSADAIHALGYTEGGKDLQPDNADSPKVEPWGISVGFTQRNHNRKTIAKTDESSVQSRIAKSKTYTIGGLPTKDGDWRSWAATVKANSMPVSYKYVPLWSLPEFTEEKTKAFFEAIEDIYGIDLSFEFTKGSAGLRYGVAAASGEAISRYSLDPDQNKRAFLELGLLSSSEHATETVSVYHKDDLKGVTKWSGFIGASHQGFFACGLRAKFLRKSGVGSISGLDVRFCSKDDWFDQEQKIVYRSHYGAMTSWMMCSARQFIVQIQPAVEINDHVDALDIKTLNMKCADLDGHSEETYSDNGFVDIIPNPLHGERTPEQPSKVIPGKVVESFRVEYGGHKSLIKGLEMKVTSADTASGPSTPVYYYECFWNLKSTAVSALFTTPIRGRVKKSKYESNQLSFITPQGMLAIESSSHYTYLEDPERPKIAITNFKSDIEEEDLPSLSFLVSATGLIDSSASSSMISGVVHPDGYGIGYQDVRYQAVDEDEGKPNIVTLILKDISENNDHVTLLTAPMWLPSSNARFPDNAGDIATASGPCLKEENIWKCSVHVGAVESVAAQKHLGFSFLAIGDQVNAEFGLSGSVTMNSYNVDENKTVLSNGVTAVASFSSSPKDFSFYAGEGDVAKFNIKNQRTGGVLLKFDPPFTDVPSIIVSPRLSKEATLSRYSLDVVQIPHVVVEHVTESEALVVAGLLNTISAGLSAVVKNCNTDRTSVQQTFYPRFNKPGWIKIGGHCLESTSDGYVDAVACNTDNEEPSSKWVFDGQRIRNADDTSMCIWGRGHNMRISLHECGSDVSRLDDERFEFNVGEGGHITLDTLYNRCLYRDGKQVKLSGANDSKCNNAINHVTFTEGLTTAGFQLASSNDDDHNFNKCFSGKTETKKIDPLGNCESSSWLLHLSADDPNDTSYALKVGGIDNDMWLARNGNDLYLTDSDNSAAQLDIDAVFFDTTLAETGDYSDYRIKFNDDTTKCVAWTRSIGDEAEYDVEGSVFEPIGFNFIAIAPMDDSTSASNDLLRNNARAWTRS